MAKLLRRKSALVSMLFASGALLGFADGPSDKSISIKFATGNTATEFSLITGEGAYGAYPVKGDLWNNVKANDGLNYSLTDLQGLTWNDGNAVEGFKFSCHGSAWGYSPASNNVFVHSFFCFPGVANEGIKLSGVPSGDCTLYLIYAEYYANGTTFIAPSVNGTFYTAVNGVTVEGNADWGSIQDSMNHVLAEGKTYLKIENPQLADGGTICIKSDHAYNTRRGSLSALQLVLHPPRVTVACDGYEGTVSMDGGAAVTMATKNADFGETITATLAATPAPGYRFVRWEGDTSILCGSSEVTDAEVSVETLGRRGLSAVFELAEPYTYALSVNFSGGRNTQNQVCPLTGTDSYGAFAVAGNCWNNISTCVTHGFTSLLWNDGVVLSGIAESNTTGGNWALGQNASANNIFYSYLDDNSTTTFTGLTRERGFPATCTVYVYTCNDGSTKFRPITVNGVAYTYVDDEVKPGTSDWGNTSYAKTGSNNCVLGGDYLKIENVPVPADGTLVIAPQPMVNVRVARCGVAAIQVLFETPSTFTVRASCDASRGQVQFGEDTPGSAVSATGTHEAEFSASLRAIPAPGYTFSHWTGCTVAIDGSSESDEVTVRTQLPIRLEAVFIPDTIPLTATWKGAGARGNLSDPANWECLTRSGGVIAGALPADRTHITISGAVAFDWPVGQTLSYRSLTMACELADDCDWCGFGADGYTGSVDLKGHELTVSAFDGLDTITDTSSAGATGTVRVIVAEGVEVTNASTVLAGGVRLVKAGTGTFVAAVANQTYTGGTDIAAGTLKLGTAANPMGPGDGTCDVTVREGATLDIARNFTSAAIYNYVDLAGTILIAGTSEGDAWSESDHWLKSLSLAGDVTIRGGWHHMGHVSEMRQLSLNGHTLTLDVQNDHIVYLHNLTSDETGGRIQIVNGSVQTASVDLRTVDVDFLGTSYLFINNNPLVKDFSYSRNYWRTHGAATTVGVYGAYRAGLYRPPLILQDGATLDLSTQTDCWSADGMPAKTGGNNRTFTEPGRVTFADGATIYIDLGTRRLAQNARVVGWDATTKPTNLDTLKFKLKGRCGKVITAADGLHVICGFFVYIAQNEESIFVPEEFFDGKTVGGEPITTDALAQAYMDQTESNGLKAWQNYAMGIEGGVPANRFDITYEKIDEETIKVKTPITVFAPPDSGVNVTYTLLKSTDAAVTWSAFATGLATPEYELSVSSLDEGNSLWKFKAVITATEG